MTTNSCISVSTHLLQHYAAKNGTEIAHQVGGNDDGSQSAGLTYAQWLREAERLAGSLTILGVGSGDRVALAFRPDEVRACAACYLALHGVGAIPLLLSPDLAPDECSSIMDRHRVKGVVAGARSVGAICDASSRAGTGAWSRGVEALLADAQGWSRLAEPDAEAVAAIIPTSGTTGTPKGVAVVHGDLTWEARVRPGLRPHILHAFPLSAGDAHYLLLRPLTYGAMVTTLADLGRAALLESSVLESVTDIFAVPYHLDVLLGAGVLSDKRMPSIRRILVGSAALAPRLLRDVTASIPAVEISMDYSTTESGRGGTKARYGVTPTDSVGKPEKGACISIRHPSTRREVTDGTAGEVWLRHAHTPIRSYDGDLEATADVFVDGWIRTGDLGRVDADGHLWLVDRIKRVANVGGVSVSCRQIEDIVASHPAVREAAAVLVPHSTLGEAMACAVVHPPEASFDDLERYCEPRLPVRGMPLCLFSVPRLPQSSTGKVLDEELRALALAKLRRPTRSVTDEAVADLVLRALREATGHAYALDEPLTTWSLSSFQLAHVHALLSDDLGITVPLALLFDSPSGHDLVRALGPLLDGRAA